MFFVVLLAAGTMLALFLLGWMAGRARVLFRITVREGRVHTVRGRIPPRLRWELIDALTASRAGQVTVLCRRVGDGLEVVFQGELDHGDQQLIRNLVGMWPVARLAQAPPVSSHGPVQRPRAEEEPPEN